MRRRLITTLVAFVIPGLILYLLYVAITQDRIAWSILVSTVILSCAGLIISIGYVRLALVQERVPFVKIQIFSTLTVAFVLSIILVYNYVEYNVFEWKKFVALFSPYIIVLVFLMYFTRNRASTRY
jgi:hypothetical protein